MRVCFFVANLGDGGAQRQCVALLNLLQHQPGIDVHLILLGPGEYERDLDTSGLTVHRTEVPNFSSPLALVFVVRTLRRIRPDVLMSWLHPADIWSYPATRIVRGVRWVLAERSSTYPDELVYRVRTRLGRLGADVVIANSPPGEQFWADMSPQTAVRVIPNMTLGTPVPTGESRRNAATDCLYVGRFMPQKNVTGIAGAFAMFAAAHPEARLRMAGQGDQQVDVRRIASDADIETQVELLGFRNDVTALMAQARLLLSLSRYEGMPNVVMEAIMAGLPVVVSDIPEHRVLLGPDYPYYVDLDAGPSVGADAIARAWEDAPRQISTLYAHAREVLAASAPDRVVAAYVEAFRNVMARPDARVLRVPRAAENGL